jgi:hypothetical protein
MVAKLDIYMQKTETRSMSVTLYKYQLTVKYKTWNSEAHAGKSREHRELTGMGNEFLNRTQMAQ